MRNRNSNKIMSVYLILGMVLLVIGFSYAFFIYNKTGLYTHTITGGKMKVIYDEVTGNNINIENAYPLTDKEALTKGLEFEFTVTGYNESEKNIYYAIEMDYGDDLDGKTRFSDTDIKLSLYENDEIVFENEIFQNLDNQDIYYNYFKAGTSSQNPTINNYKLRIWINDNVIISDTMIEHLDEWGDLEWDWFYERYNSEDEMFNDLMNACPSGSYGCYLSDLGISVYTSDEFANSYANFKVNIKADLNYKDYDNLMYDPNGGTFDIDRSSLLTNMVTTRKPVKENYGFLGWSSDSNATVPEYLSGDYYAGDGQMLYAVYSDKRNVMSDFSSLGDIVHSIIEVYFINDTSENIEAEKQNADSAYDLTLDNQGSVTGLLYGDILYVVSDGTTYLSAGKKLFSDFYNLNYIDFSNIDTSMVTDMSSMFGQYYNEEDDSWYGGPSLETLDLSSFNTSKVTDMSFMINCFVLSEIDLSYLDTSNVTNMQGMFYGIASLDALDLSNFDTSKVTDMSSMFYGVSYGAFYKELNLSSFDTSNVTDMSYMFYSCIRLTSLDLSNFNTSNVTNMEGMFQGCNSLEELNISSFNTSKVEDMSSMFSARQYGASWWDEMILETIDVSGFDVSNVIDMGEMFYDCSGLIELDVSNWDTSGVENMNGMFYNCSNLPELSVNGFDVSNAVDISYMFYRCGNLVTLNVTDWNTSNVTTMQSVFDSCVNLIVLDVSNWNTDIVRNMRCIFNNCGSLTTLNLSNWNTSNVTDMSNMFSSCYNLTNIDLTNLETNNVTDMRGMFSGCSKLTTLDLSSFDINKVTTTYYMFNGCSKLKTIYANTDWNTSTNTSSGYMFTNCTRLVGAISYNSSNVTIAYANPTTGYFTTKTV